jgi:hypothetical protein
MPQQTQRQASLGDYFGQGLQQGIATGMETARARALMQEKGKADAAARENERELEATKMLLSQGYEITPENRDIVLGRAKQEVISPAQEARQLAGPVRPGEQMPEIAARPAVLGKMPQLSYTAQKREELSMKADDKKMQRQLQNAQLASFAQREKMMPLEYQAKMADIGKSQAQAKQAMQEISGGKKLSAGDVAKFNEGNQIPIMLQDVDAVIKNNQDAFGPVAGRIAALNPYNERAQTIDASMRTASQAFGRFMEGGVLRKEDEEKYRKMFPALSDTPELAANKLQIVNKLLTDKQVGTLKALKSSGYDIGGIEQAFSKETLPGILTDNQKSIGQQAVENIIPSATAGVPSFEEWKKSKGLIK